MLNNKIQMGNVFILTNESQDISSLEMFAKEPVTWLERGIDLLMRQSNISTQIRQICLIEKGRYGAKILSACMKTWKSISENCFVPDLSKTFNAQS